MSGERDERLNAYLDGALDEAERTRLERELSESDAAALDALREQDRELRDALAPPPVDEDALVRGVMEEVDDVPSPAWVAPSRPTIRPLLLVIPAAAAGFLLGYLLFGRGAVVPPADGGSASVAIAPAGRIEVVTGEVRARTSGAGAFATVGPGASLEPGVELRTSPGARCTVRLEGGGLVRLDRDTSLDVVDGHRVELGRGRLFAVASPEARLEVAAADAIVEARDSRFDLERSPRAMKGGTGEETALRVLSGRVRVGEREVGPNQVVWLEASGVSDPQRRDDLVLSTRWTHDLLRREAGGAEELEGRVTALVARIGFSKIDAQFEEAVRSFGDHAVPALLRIARAEGTPLEPYQRFEAARIACDLATAEHLADLIGLLEDTDPDVRVRAARALRRLTGVGANFDDGYWRGEDREAGLRFWRNRRE